MSPVSVGSTNEAAPGFHLVEDADLQWHPVALGPENQWLTGHDLEVDLGRGISDRLEPLDVSGEGVPIDQEIDVTMLSCDRSFEQRLFSDAPEHPDRRVKRAKLGDDR